MITPQPIGEPAKSRWLQKHIPYRMQALQAMRIYNERGADHGPMLEVHPPLYLACLVTCRVFMDFLCVKVPKKSATLVPLVARAETTDVHVIDLGGDALDLATLAATELDLLSRTYKAAHVAAAHLAQEATHSLNCDEVLPAANLIEEIVDKNLYGKLGFPRSHWKP